MAAAESELLKMVPDPKMPDEEKSHSGESKDKLNTLQVVSSVFAAGLGVQSSKNRERDFKKGSISVFIAAGIVFTLLFIAVIVLVVQTVIRSTGH